MVIALFCRLQGTTMEHNQDVYHVSRFPKIEPRRLLKANMVLLKNKHIYHMYHTDIMVYLGRYRVFRSIDYSLKIS